MKLSNTELQEAINSTIRSISSYGIDRNINEHLKEHLGALMAEQIARLNGDSGESGCRTLGSFAKLSGYLAETDQEIVKDFYEWLERHGYLEKYLENFDVEFFNKQTTDDDDLVMDAFVWSDSEEGFDYWDTANDKYLVRNGLDYE